MAGLCLRHHVASLSYLYAMIKDVAGYQDPAAMFENSGLYRNGATLISGFSPIDAQSVMGRNALAHTGRSY